MSTKNIKDRIAEYLENVCCFRDYTFKSLSEYKDRDLTNSMVYHLVYRQAKDFKVNLDKAIYEFSSKYSNIVIYF